MKKLLTILLLTSFLSFAQPEHTGELIIEVINKGSSWNVTFELTAVGDRWDDSFKLTDEFEYTSINLYSPHKYIALFDHILDNNHDPEYTVAIGLYKISAIENNQVKDYFYMDWRTSDLNGTSFDVYFKYDYSTKKFRDNDNTVNISHTLQTLWELTDFELETDGLQEYWDNCFVFINNGSNNPRLVWGPYPETIIGTVTGFNIYRSAEHSYGSTPNNFTVLQSVGTSVFNYVDSGVDMGTDYYARSYYVVCTYTDPQEYLSDTENSNTIEVRIAHPQKNNSDNNLIYIVNNFSLEQNYPNPFNPVTIINYQLVTSNYVTLKVFDVLGNEVITLVNEYKEAGNYKVEFDASGLTSGVYFYTINAGLFTDTKKMILNK